MPTRPFQLILLAIFALAAVGGLILFASFNGFTGSTQSVGVVTIWGTLPTDAVNGQVNALKGTRKEFAGVTYVQRPAATFDADLANALAEGTGPDLVILSQEQLVAERNKLSVIPFTSIPERTYLDTYVPIAELFLTDKGTYGIPYVVDPLVLYYNRTLFSSAGIATPPATWEAVTGLAQKLTVRSGGQIQKSAIALGGYSNIPNARAVLSLLFLQAGNPITQTQSGTLRATLAGGGSATGVTPAASAVSFYAQFANAAKTVYAWNSALPDARQTFIAGDLAMYLGYASEQKYLAAANPNLDFDMAPAPQPGTNAARVTYGQVYAFALPKASKNSAGAYQAATALASKGEAAGAARALSMAPAIRSALTPSTEDRFEPVYYPQALTAKGWLSPAPADIDRIFAAMMGSINTGLKDVEEALATADQALNAAL